MEASTGKKRFNPKVSIIIPVYNGSNYLQEAIDSALNQTYQPIEVIVVNDGSQDEGKTDAIAKSYEDGIRYYSKKNGGVASALNLGIQKMNGEFFSWLSHDDVYYPDKIERQTNRLAEGPKDVILYSDYDIIDRRSKWIGSKSINYIEPDNFRYALTVSHPLNGCTALIPKLCFDRCGLFDESLRTTQDYDMWFRMAKEFKFVHMDERLIKSRAHSQQGIHSMSAIHVKECNDLLIKFVKELPEEEIVQSTQKPLGLSYAEVAVSFRKRGFFKAANHSIKLSLHSFYRQSLSDKIQTLGLIFRSFVLDSLMYMLKKFIIKLKRMK